MAGSLPHSGASPATDPAESVSPGCVQAPSIDGDLTVEALAEENARLRRELELLNRVLEAAPSGFMVADMTQPGRPIVYVNDGLLRQTGQTREQLMGQPSAVLTSALSSLEVRETVRQGMQQGRELSVDFLVPRADGSTYWAHVIFGPIRNEAGQVTHYVTVGTDITDRVNAQRHELQLQQQLIAEMRERERVTLELALAQKLESVGRLAAGVAHEINTPIHYISDSVQYLKDATAALHGLLDVYRKAFQALPRTPAVEAALQVIAQTEADVDLPFVSEETPKAIERTLAGVERVAHIVRAMKEFSYPATNELRPADINEALELTLVVATHEYKYVATVEQKLGMLPPVLCNIGELNQVFVNLIVNAAHALGEAQRDPGTGRILVETFESAGWVHIVIADNGRGIAPEHLPKIFDPFFTTKPVGKGTGQGLAIARSIVVDKHQGAIDVHSEMGVGTRFTLRLPVRR